ncbi:CHASE2 domain-containing protein [Alkalinema pantanalense CENA528]|uniref:CHASE2 domain-containing protein n=1 Tax=Alkalinema pantanalense TaxID=1620705 RepID=UPI003D6F5496
MLPRFKARSNPSNPPPFGPPDLPPGSTPDVFISYSRRDKAFVQKLHDALRQGDRDLWVDWQNIQPTEQWWRSIQSGIEAANTFVFILSPDSVTSEVCGWEIEHAIQNNKRLVPVIYRDVDPQQVHPTLSALNWIFLRDQDDFEQGFRTLVTAIDTDLDYAKQHTRLQIKALEWDRNHRDPSFLLRGKDLIQAETWLQASPTKAPSPTELQTQYITTSRKAPGYRPSLPTLVLTSAAMLLAIGGIRVTGLLEPIELWAFDRLAQTKPVEGPDDRFLIIEVTEADIKAQLQRNENARGTLSDVSLNRLLSELLPYQPRLIGLDLYRDFAIDPQVKQLAQRFQTDDRIIGLCKLPNGDGRDPTSNRAINPPPNIPVDRLGFSDVVYDVDLIVRKQMLVRKPLPEMPCPTIASFSWAVATHYLQRAQGSKIPEVTLDAIGRSIALGKAELSGLGLFSNAYQGSIDSEGHYLLVNYRLGSGKTPQEQVNNLAKRVTLEEVLNRRLTEQDVRDRIVLIGITSEANNDYFKTPYGPIMGVVLQAQMTSQLLSAVLNARPLLQVWPLWLDVLWIWAWGGVGSAIVFLWLDPLRRVVFLGIAIGGLVGVSYLVFIVGHRWVPLLPPAMMLVTTASLAVAVTTRQQQLKAITKP